MCCVMLSYTWLVVRFYRYVLNTAVVNDGNECILHSRHSASLELVHLYTHEPLTGQHSGTAHAHCDAISRTM